MAFTGYAFDIHAYDDPNGTALVRLTPSKTVTLAFRQPETGFGMSDGQIIIHSAHADATAANFHKHNLVKVIKLPEETKVGAFFLEEGDFTALSTAEQGGRLLHFHGPNTWYYLERAILREQPYTSESIPFPDRRGGINVPGYWTWGEDADGREPGPIMVRVLEEGRDQPGNPLGDATWDFDRTNDSASNAWDATGDTWQVQIGTTMLDMAIMFVRSGNFWFRAGPDLDYSAYNADPGVDRTSGTFASGKVRFAAGVNIVTEVRRKISASVERSAMLVSGSVIDEEDDRYAFVTGGSSDVPWIGHINAGEVAGPGRLNAIGGHDLQQRSVRTEEAIPLTHIVADAEGSGGYVPFIHYAPGDIVTIHTGSDDHDFTNAPIVVAAARIYHDEAGNWFGTPELGEQVMSADTKAFEERGNLVCCGPRPPTPTVPPGAGTPDTILFSWHFDTDADTDNSDGYLWRVSAGVPAWSANDGGIARTGGVGNGGALAADSFPASPGVEYLVTARQRNRWGLNTTDGVVLRLDFLNSVGGSLATHYASPGAITDEAWVNVSVQATAPALTTDMHLGVVRGPSGTSGALHHDIDDVVVTLVGTGSPDSGGYVGNGLPEIIGTPGTYTGAGGVPLVIRDSPPTLTDDVEYGYPERTVWIHVDDLDDPTQVFGRYVLIDSTAGAAVWVQDAAPLVHDHEAEGADSSIEDLAHGVVLFAMHRADENRPYLLWSRDGVTFADVIGEMLFDFGASSRDPSLLHWDNAYWVAHTGPSDEEKFTVWRSDSLTSGWVQHDQPAVAGAFRVWAPEWFLDPATGQVHIFFARAATDFDDFSIYEIHPTDRDMTTWSTPVQVSGLSTHSNMIDPFVVYAPQIGDTTKPYKLFYKQENTEGPGVALAEAAVLTGPYTVIETDDWAGWVGARDSIEGFSVIELEDGRWRAYFTENDGFGTVAHWYSDSVDAWASWSTPAETAWPWTPGHGTPLRLPSTIDLMRSLASESDVAAFDDLTDVTITTPVVGEMPRWNGSAWVNDAGMICVDPGSIAVDDGDPFGVTLTSVWGIDAGTPYYDDANAAAGEEAALFYDPLTDNYVLIAYDFEE